MFRFDPFPVLQTNRLCLRQVTADDAADIFIMRSDPEVMKYIPRPMAVEVEDVLPVITLINEGLKNGERINWGITFRDSNKVIGMIGYVNTKPDHYRAEVGYSLCRAYHRKGIMLEALLKVIEYGFAEMNLHTIEAIIDAENTASGALLQAVGFKREAFFREDFYFNNSYRNSIHYGLLHTDPINFRGRDNVSRPMKNIATVHD